MSIDRSGLPAVEFVWQEIDFIAIYDAIAPENRHAEVSATSQVERENVEWQTANQKIIRIADS